MKKNLITVILLASLLLNSPFVLANEIPKNKINKSVTDQNITFTVDDYRVNSNGNGLIIYYTVNLKKSKIDETQTPLTDRPDIFIEGKKINSTLTLFKEKVNKHKYKGSVEVTLPQSERPNPFSVKFNVDSLFEQEGQWTVSFKVQ